jgi:APA family basic amino acid/polyamine antiporter
VSGQTPARVLGPFDATCIVIGAIIGVGIFFNPSKIAALTETPALTLGTWILAGLIAMCGALAYAELGRRHSSSGAQYQILRDGYGPGPAFLYVFCNATAIQAGAIAVIAVVCARNLAVVAGYSPKDPTIQTALTGLGLGLIGILVVANIVGARAGAGIQNLTVISKVATLLVIVGLALFAPAHEIPPAAAPKAAPLPGVAGVLAGLVPAFFAYGGFQHALWIGGEVREPRRNVPRAIIVGVGIVVLVYGLANWAYLKLLGRPGVAASDALAADAVSVVFHGGGGRAIAAAVAISAFGVLNAQLLSGPRLVYGMARDGRFFGPFANLHPKLGTPVAAIVMMGALAVGLLLIAGFGGVDKLTAGVVFIDGCFLGLTGATVLFAAARAAADDGSGAAAAPIPGSKIAAAIFVLGELGLLTGAYLDKDMRQAAFIGLGWIAVAAVLYFVRFRRPRQRTQVGLDPAAPGLP